MSVLQKNIDYETERLKRIKERKQRRREAFVEKKKRNLSYNRYCCEYGNSLYCNGDC